MLFKFGALLDDKKRFKGLVKDLFPEQVKNVNLLLMAYNMGIVQDIQAASHINNAFAFRYVKRLMDEFGISRANADWIVSMWCVCYGEKVLGKSCEITLKEQAGGARIQEEKEPFGKSYGDLFQYEKSSQANGLSVIGFSGNKNATIIFQNKSGNMPVVEIAEGSFSNCGIEEAILTEGIAFIGKRAFASCRELHQVVLPADIKEIGDEAFVDCDRLKSISMPVTLERIGSEAFRKSGLKTLQIPKSVYWIGDSALADCRSLERVEIPDTMDIIPDGMFAGCSGLKKVTLHENLEVIGARAFLGCSSLDIMIIPDSVKSIGDDAFTDTDKQFIMQCSFGSCAEQYARTHKIKYQLV